MPDREKCLKWDAETKEFLEVPLTLKPVPVASMCWAVDQYGVLLLAGKRTDYVLADGSDSCQSFNLKLLSRYVEDTDFIEFVSFIELSYEQVLVAAFDLIQH